MKFPPIVKGLAATLAALSLAGALAAAHVERAAAHPRHGGARKRTKNLLVVTVTKGFRHDSIPVAEEVIAQLGTQTKEWDTDFVRTDEEMQAKMTPGALKKYDAVVFANTTGDLPLPDYPGFLNYVREGHGFVAMHSGSDTLHSKSDTEISPYVTMLGAEFQTHHQQCAIQPALADPTFPALKRPLQAAKARMADTSEPGDPKQADYILNNQWNIFDEIYLFRNVDRAHLHVLLSLDRHPNDGSPEANQPGEYLVSWAKSYGRGRVFYTSLGHRQEVWRSPLYQQHILGGIEFALGLAKGVTAPTPQNAALAPQ